MGFHSPTADGTAAGPKPACGYLLESMRIAGANRAVVGLRPGKWDIPAHLADGAAYGLTLAYTVIPDSPGVPWTVRQALQFAPDARVLFGFPDIVFRPADALARVERRQRERGSNVVLGLFPARQPSKMDMVALDDDGFVQEIVIKPRTTTFRSTWLFAVWNSAFSIFLETHLQTLDAHDRSANEELHLGNVISAALAHGWHVDAVEIHEGVYYDIGTHDELVKSLGDFG